MVCLFYSCRYDKIEPKCEDLPPSKNDIWGYDYTFPPNTYYAASFNPANPKEIVFYRRTWTASDICYFDTQSKTLRIIYSPTNGFDSGEPQWGNNNWIFFPMKDRHIWKIKANGDSLTRVTQFPLCFNPKFNTDKDILIYRHMWGTPQYSAQIYISDPMGKLIDSLPCISHRGIFAWQNSQYIASYVNADPSNSIGTIRVINPQTKEETDVSTYNYNGNSENGMCWIDDNTLIYMMEDGVYKVNVVTKKTTQLRVTCETKNYSSPSYSPALNKMLVTKTTKKIVGDNLVESVSKLCFMDTEGNEVETIEIPE